MRPERWMPIVALAAGLLTCPNLPTLAVEPEAGEPESITLRGETQKVWPFDDLRARGFEIPRLSREENSFWVYLDAINAFKEMPDDVSGPFAYAMETAWPAGHDEKLSAFLLDPDNQRSLALGKQASESESFQLYYFGDPSGSIISVLLPSLSSFRHLGKLLVVDGRRLEEAGDFDGAFENYTTAMRMGHHVAGGITLIENLVGVSLWAISDRAISQMVLRRDLTADQLENILETLREMAPSCPATLPGLRNERKMGMIVVDELTARPLHLIRNMNGLSGAGTSGDSPMGSAQPGWGRLEARVGKLFLPDRTIKKQMGAYYDELIERAAKPAYEARWNEFDDEQLVLAIPQWNVLARILLPSLTRASILAERVRMQSLATRLCVALLLHAEQHDGEIPTRLTDLRDEVPAADLIDPFSGREFVFNRQNTGWLLYSFSENGADDGGKQGPNAFEPDYVIQYPPADVVAFDPGDDNSDAQ